MGLPSHRRCAEVLTAVPALPPPTLSPALPSASQHHRASGLGIFPEKRLFICFSGGKSWNLGRSNAKLSYYDGMIQLNYKDGTPYNNERHTPRATLLTFLCDRDAGVGFPEYQVGIVLCVCTCVCPCVCLQSNRQGGRERQSCKGRGREKSGQDRACDSSGVRQDSVAGDVGAGMVPGDKPSSCLAPQDLHRSLSWDLYLEGELFLVWFPGQIVISYDFN